MYTTGLHDRRSMRGTRLSEQLLQPSLLQSVVGADRDAIAPATNLLNGEPVTSGRLAHLNLKLGSWRDRVGPATVFSADTPRAAAS
jgi:hypothetical protein